MTDIALMVGADYKTAEGDVVSIVGKIDKDDPEKSRWYKLGYRFISNLGDDYLADGTFDAGRKTPWLDLVEAVPNLYLVSLQHLDRHEILKADNPKLALENTIMKFGDDDKPKVYRLTDVTPTDLE